MTSRHGEIRTCPFSKESPQLQNSPEGQNFPPRLHCSHSLCPVLPLPFLSTVLSPRAYSLVSVRPAHLCLTVSLPGNTDSDRHSGILSLCSSPQTEWWWWGEGRSTENPPPHHPGETSLKVNTSSGSGAWPGLSPVLSWPLCPAS